MKATPSLMPEILVIEPEIFHDERGFFFESFNQRKFDELIGRSICFVQDNHSKSNKGVLRGMHYQKIRPQAKLVRVLHGEIFDVAVDVRECSPSFGRWVGHRLSSVNLKQHWIPEGFAHGFLVMSDSAEVLYKATDYYFPEYEVSIRWDDPFIGINWPNAQGVTMSSKDQKGRFLSDFLNQGS